MSILRPERFKFYYSEIQKNFQKCWNDLSCITKAKIGDDVVEYTECVSVKKGFSKEFGEHKDRFKDSIYLGEGYIYSCNDVLQYPYSNLEG